MRQNRDIPFGLTASIYSFNPSFAADLFFSSPFVCPQKNYWSPQIPEARSTGSKQTLNGLFIFITRVVADSGPIYKIDPALFYPGKPEVYRWIEKN
jgi:hypothetical protein